MKRTFAILYALTVLAALPAAGQHYVGIRGGYGASYGRFYPVQEQKIVWGMVSGGFAWKFYSPQRFVGGVGAEVEFIQKGYEYNVQKILNYEVIPTDTTFRRVVNSINIPIIWQPHVTMFRNRMRVFINLGVSVSYNLPVSKVEMRYQNQVYDEFDYKSKLVRDNPFGYGLIGGFGFNVVLAPRFELSAEARYYFNYGDILRNRNRYPGDEVHMLIRSNGTTDHPLRSPVDNINVSIGLFYRLSDGPQSPQPGKRALRRQLAREQRTGESEIVQ